MAGYFVESQTGYIQIQIQLWWQARSDAKYGGNQKLDKYQDILWFDDACEDHKQKKSLVLGKEKHVTFEEDDVYDQKDAAGFIKLNALRLKMNAKR